MGSHIFLSSLHSRATSCRSLLFFIYAVCFSCLISFCLRTTLLTVWANTELFFSLSLFFILNLQRLLNLTFYSVQVFFKLVLISGSCLLVTFWHRSLRTTGTVVPKSSHISFPWTSSRWRFCSIQCLHLNYAPVSCNRCVSFRDGAFLWLLAVRSQWWVDPFKPGISSPLS